MTNEELFQDLKQYIDTSISQHTAHLATRDQVRKIVKDEIESEVAGLRIDLGRLEEHINDRFDTVLDAIGERFETVETKVDDHERRLGRLEHRTT